MGEREFKIITIANNETVSTSNFSITKGIGELTRNKDISTILPDFKEYDITIDNFLFEFVNSSGNSSYGAVTQFNYRKISYDNNTGKLSYKWILNRDKDSSGSVSYNILLLV